MIRPLSLLSLAFCSAAALAETSPPIVAGSIVNAWTQAGLRVTDKPFDLAIQGNGFFALRLPSGEEAFSRYGEMSLDSRGILLHTPTKGQVLGYCDGEIGPIDLSRFARDVADGSIAKSFRIELNGTITAAYENGYTRETCRVALTLFQNPQLLKRGLNHVLNVTGDSGQPSLGMPQVDGRGNIYGSSLEELDEQMYRLNTKATGTDRGVEEMEKSRIANEQWHKQKTLFYVYDLGVTRSELSKIEVSEDKLGKEIQKIVAIAVTTPNEISDDEFGSKIRIAVDQHEDEVLGVLGQERLDKTKKFREEFNRDVWVKFGTSLRFTGF